jgi:hypothetical protein
MKTPYVIVLLLIASNVSFFSCEREDTLVTGEKKSLNALSMEVNSEFWEPSIPYGNVCKKTVSCYEGGFGGGPDGYVNFYEIYAYKDPRGRDDHRAENRLRIQVTDANKLGIYELKDSVYWNYAVYNITTPDGTKKYYYNSTKKVSFTMEIEKFIKTKSNAFTGIEGNFHGVLYTKENPLDSLVITNGLFKFIVGNNADQCDTYWLLEE